ncbi:hypothetical protein [Clostridium sp. ZS2-4]|uniref:hypothetical protein n=1 Tax=Clostridium sp. ZS2-4 TaxID=2987703 RepID=UPI00227A9B66|nr:hypothetical protein [Clostridium sp. ZS2-4]MCY6355874.1 hypothetical protein [Clostridium sp. ZS2-4]
MNLHTIYNSKVLGEVYLVPVYEYDDKEMENNKIAFKKTKTNIEKYISFFSAISGRKDSTDDNYKYERVALIIVDFSPNIPIVYTNTSQLKQDELVSKNFNLELENISIKNFTKDILNIYNQRFDINNFRD